MINVFVKRGFTDVWDPYLSDWGGREAHDFEIRTYEDMRDLEALPAGPVIFADIERLTPTDRELAKDVERVIADTRPDIPMLNSPTRTLRRYDLLRELYDRGLNPFRAYRLTDTTTPVRFPVFLRYENDHTGATTGLLHSQQDLNRAIVRARIRQHNLRDLIIVEYVDVSNGTGLFEKFSAFRVGDVIVPRGRNFSTDWVVKFGGSIENEETQAMALDYVRNNPHEHLLDAPFDTGHIEYGRIDYSMIGDSVVTWEINTNPMMMTTRRTTHPMSVPRSSFFLSRFGAALGRVTPEDLDSTPISLSGVTPQLRVSSHDQPGRARSFAQSFGRRHKRLLEPAVRAVELASVPFERRILARWKRESRG